MLDEDEILYCSSNKNLLKKLAAIQSRFNAHYVLLTDEHRFAVFHSFEYRSDSLSFITFRRGLLDGENTLRAIFGAMVFGGAVLIHSSDAHLLLVQGVMPLSTTPMITASRLASGLREFDLFTLQRRKEYFQAMVDWRNRAMARLADGHPICIGTTLRVNPAAFERQEVLWRSPFPKEAFPPGMTPQTQFRPRNMEIDNLLGYW